VVSRAVCPQDGPSEYRPPESLQAEEAEELGQNRGKWRCVSCSWIGEMPVSDSETWELEAIRGVSPKRLDRIADCPACGCHLAYLVGDPGRPIPKDFPLPGFWSSRPMSEVRGRGHPADLPRVSIE
jgi:hypothetical protein